MLLEFVNRLVELAELAKTTEIVPAGFRTYVRDGVPELHPPPPRDDHVYDMVSLNQMVDLFARESCQVYCHSTAAGFSATAVLNGELRSDRVTLVSGQTAAFQAIDQVEAGLSVRELSVILRTTLYDAIPAEVTHAISRIDWTASDEHQADAATMGRNISRQVASMTDTSLPETCTLKMAVFDIPDLVVHTEIRCAIMPNHEARTIAIVPIAGTQAAIDAASLALCAMIAERFLDGAGINVVFGFPAALKFDAGSPNR